MKDKIKKVIVCGHDQKFWKPIQDELEKTGQFEFREDYWRGHDEHDPEKSLESIEWADVIMAEWTMGNAVWYSKNKKKHQKLITRLHLQERNTPYPGELNINNVDKIVFVGEHIQHEVIEKFAIPEHKTTVVSNYVDFDRYALPKNPESRFNLGIIGVVPLRKRLDLAVDLLERLLKVDPRYCLHVKGPRPDSYGWLWARTAEREYYLELWSKIKASGFANRVIFHPPGDDVQEWFQNIGYLLSPSDFESFHMAVPEGMCSNTVPVLWNWEGAADIYRLVQPVKSLQQAEDWVVKSNGSTAGWRMGQQASAYCKTHFDKDNIVSQWFDLLTSGTNQEEVISSADSKLTKRVLVFWLIGNWAVFHRKEMIEGLAANLPDNMEVLVVEPGDDAQALIKLGWETTHSLAEYANNRPAQVAPKIHKVRIVFDKNTATLSKLNGEKSVNRQKSSQRLNELVSEFYGKSSEVLHWIYKPNQTERLAGGIDSRFVYEIYDDYVLDFATGQPKEAVKLQEELICQKAQHVFFTSKTLEQRKKQNCQHFTTVSNGVNYKAFEKYRVDQQVPAELKLRKSVGYLGNLSDFFAWELMLNVAKKLPDIDFFFHGNIEFKKMLARRPVIDEMMNLPNTVFPGLVTREQGAAAVARYDVLTIPFVVNKAMHAVNPLKLWEYFAVGKPVISSPMDATQYLSELVFFAETVDQWCDLITELTENGISQSARENQIEHAKMHSWSELTSMHAQVVEQVFESQLSPDTEK